MESAFNADFGGPSGIYIADYFTEEEFELFGIVSERMVMALDEIALRHRQLGQHDHLLGRVGDHKHFGTGRRDDLLRRGDNGRHSINRRVSGIRRDGLR